jgi:hypothetical protein
MAAQSRLAVVAGPAPASPGGPVNPTAHLAQAHAGFDPESVINAHEAHLADYLNQPVQDILARLGLPALAEAALPSADPNAAAPSSPAPSATSPAAPASPFDASQLIQPVTDALGTLGSGQFGNLDPTQMFGGIAQALESAGQSVGQAMGSLGGDWQGAAASAAGAKASAALADGTEVAGQASGISATLSTAAAVVQQAQAQLMAIINEFAATMAAIGPNIIFPWGIAAAIAAANQAITQASETMTELEGSLAGQAAQVNSIGAPVALTSMSQLGAQAASVGAPVAGAAPGLAQAVGPLLQTATGLASPALEGVSTAVSAAVQAGTSSAAGGQAAGPTTAPDGPADSAAADQAAGRAAVPSALGGGATGGPGAAAVTPTRLASSVTPPQTETDTAATRGSAVVPASVGMGAAPMAGGAPMGAGARPGADRGHNAASFLHTTDQGDEIIGDLGNVAPPVIGDMDGHNRSDIELTI